MSTKTIKAWVNGAVQEIEVESIVSPTQELSYDERLDILEKSSIPAVTTDDNGKFLRVVDGVWAADGMSSAEEAIFGV